MPRPKIGFLPAFFVTLGVVFGLALWLRIRSYDHKPPATTSSAAVEKGGSSGGALPVIGITAQPNATAAATGVLVEQRPRRRVSPPPQTPAPQPAKTSTPAAAPVKPQAVVTPAPPPPKPSLLARLVAPIVNAFTGGSSKPGQGFTSSSGSSSSSSSGHTTSTDPQQKDPTSDTQPPQLVSVSFLPPQIHDGEDTVLTVEAVDDLSGVRSVSGTIAAPSGAVQGFACQRQADSNQYVARIAVPQNAAQGVWRINYLSLIDNASNATTMSTGLPPTATFRVVSSDSDTQGPTLKAVWVDRPAIRAGEKNTVFVDAEDDNSGVNLVSGVFISPSKHARVGFVCRPGAGSVWQGDLSTPACIDCGDWQLEQVQLQDKANNMTTVRSDNPIVGNVRLNIMADRCDATAPSIDTLVLDRNAVSNAQDSVINVIVSASDDSCGVMSMSGQVTGPTTAGNAPRLYFSFTPSGDSWTGRITVPKLAAKGTWRITWIQVLDQAHNLRTYSQGEPVLANAFFQVQ